MGNILCRKLHSKLRKSVSQQSNYNFAGMEKYLDKRLFIQANHQMGCSAHQCLVSQYQLLYLVSWYAPLLMFRS